MDIPAKLHAVAEKNGYILEYRPTVRVRGWPQESEKPFAMFWSDGSYICSFKTLVALERNLRGRAGC